MIKNEIKTTQKSTVITSTTTSPINKQRISNQKTKTNSFLAWLSNEDITSSNESITLKSAVLSFAKGLIEIVKTIYNKPIVSALTITTGVVLTYFAHHSALATVMSLCVISGIAGLGYAIYTAITKKTGMESKQAYELMGISSFVLAIGIYGLLI